MKHDNFDWEIFSKLPKKRQQRLKGKLNQMEVEIQINEIAIVKEDEHSIMAMVPCQSGSLRSNIYLDYIFDTDQIVVKYVLESEKRFTRRIVQAFKYIFYPSIVNNELQSTTLSKESVEQIVDFFVAVLNDMDESNGNNDDDT